MSHLYAAPPGPVDPAAFGHRPPAGPGAAHLQDDFATTPTPYRAHAHGLADGHERGGYVDVGAGYAYERPDEAPSPAPTPFKYGGSAAAAAPNAAPMQPMQPMQQQLARAPMARFADAHAAQGPAVDSAPAKAPQQWQAVQPAASRSGSGVPAPVAYGSYGDDVQGQVEYLRSFVAQGTPGGRPPRDPMSLVRPPPRPEGVGLPESRYGGHHQTPTRSTAAVVESPPVVPAHVSRHAAPEDVRVSPPTPQGPPGPAAVVVAAPHHTNQAASAPSYSPPQHQSHAQPQVSEPVPEQRAPWPAVHPAPVSMPAPQPPAPVPSVAAAVAALRAVPLDGALHAIAQYLKDEFAAEPGEATRGIETMAPEDVAGLAQCFQSEVERVIEDLQKAPAPPPPAHGSAYPSASGAPTPVHAAPVPHHATPSRAPSAMMPSDTPQPPPAQASAPRHRSASPGVAPPQAPRYGDTPGSVRGPSHDRGGTLERAGSVRSASPLGDGPPLKQLMEQLRQGEELIKYGRSGGPKLRFFAVQDREVTIDRVVVRLPHLCWAAPGSRAKPSGAVPLLHLLEVVPGAAGKSFTRNGRGEVTGLRGEAVDPRLCLTLVFASRPVDLLAVTPESYRLWYRAMQLILQCNKRAAAKKALA